MRHRRKVFSSSNTYTYTWELELEEEDLIVTMEFEISYNYSSGRKSYDYYVPDDPPELEIEGVEMLSIQVGDQDTRDPTEFEKRECEKKFQEYIDKNYDTFWDLLGTDVEHTENDAYADYCDRKYDEMRDEGRI